jgi:predicted dehydrogenase
MGNVHANQYLKMSEVSLTVFDGQSERSRNLAERTGASVAATVEDLIRNVDVVDICLPTDLHAEFGLKAIAEGRAVFMEKPITRNWEDAVALAKAATQAGVPVMPGQVVRFFPEFRTAKSMIESGAVGTPAAARTRRGGGAPGGSQGWFMDHRRSGGILLDLAIHDFDWLRWTLGEVDYLYSRAVAAQTQSGPDYALTTLTFKSGAVAHTESTWMDPSGFRVTFEVAGKDGIIQFDSRDQPAVRIATSGGASAGDYLSVSETPLSPTDDPYYLELRGFLDAVRNGTPPPVTIEDGLAALSISLAAIESSQTGRVVRPISA